jgi:glycosyltransferase involved in cell wall biosynthesis
VSPCSHGPIHCTLGRPLRCWALRPGLGFGVSPEEPRDCPESQSTLPSRARRGSQSGALPSGILILLTRPSPVRVYRQGGSLVFLKRMSIESATLIIVVPTLDYGGLESQTVVHVKELVGTFRSIRVCCFHEAGLAAEEIRRLGVPVDVLNVTPSVRNFRATVALVRYLFRHKADVIHTRTGAVSFHGLLASLVVRTPVRVAEEVGLPERPRRMGRFVFPILYRLATGVIGVSDSVVDFLIEADRVNPERVVRIYNSVDASFFSNEPREEPRGFRIVTVGRLATVKAHDCLIRSVAPLVSEDPDVSLVIVGDGPERKRLTQLSQELSVSSAVHFAGHQSGIAEVLRSASVFVLSSTSEGLGIALLEAMASKVPVISTAVGGVPEVMGPVASEWLVEPGDETALTESLRRMKAMSSEERALIGARLSQHALATFSVQRYKAELVSLYSTLLEGRHRAT